MQSQRKRKMRAQEAVQVTETDKTLASPSGSTAVLEWKKAGQHKADEMAAGGVLANVYKSLGRCTGAMDMLDKAKMIAQTGGTKLNSAHMNEWAKSHTASLTVQCNFRIHLARQTMLAAMKGVYSKKVVPLQAAVRRILAQVSSYATLFRIRKRSLLKIESTTRIQSIFRRAHANHPWVRVLQGVDGMCARTRASQVCRHASKRNAAISLQACVRARLQAIQGAKQIEQGIRDRLSCRLQACCRCYGLQKVHRATIASISLQAAIRRQQSIKTIGALKLALGASSHARAAVCRHKYAQTVGRVLLEAYVRAHVERKTWRTIDGAAQRKMPSEMDTLDQERAETQRLAILVIQARIRRFMQRSVGEDQMQNARQTDLCSLLQAACRRQRARKECTCLLASLSSEEAANQRLSHFAEASNARRRHASRRGASVRLQASLRRRLGQSCGDSHMQMSRDLFACQQLQAACRRSVAREAHRKGLAAETIQMAMLRRRKDLSMQSLQAACRRILAREAHRRGSSARTLQAASRRRRAYQARMEEEYAASCLHGICRAGLAFGKHVKKRASAIDLQAVLRQRLGHLHGQSVMEDSRRRRDNEVCATLERFLKAAIPRRKHAEKQIAVWKLQAPLRRSQGQVKVKEHMEESRKDLSMQSLQAACRRILAREAHRRGSSARTLQAASRRRRAYQARMEEEYAASCLHGICRAGLAFGKHVKKRASAIDLQAVLRQRLGHLHGQSVMEHSRRGSAAEYLDVVCRRMLTRDAYCKDVGSQIIQAAMRSRHAGQVRMQKIFACATLQHFVKSKLNRRQFELNPQQSDRSSQMVKIWQLSDFHSLEAACRRMLVRDAYRRFLAAQTLQAAICWRRDRLTWQERLRAHGLLQHIFKAASARQKYSVERCAAICMLAEEQSPRLQAAVDDAGVGADTKEIEVTKPCFLLFPARTSMFGSEFSPGLESVA